MAYSTGISSTIADLIGAIRTFALAQGFAASSTWAAGDSQTGVVNMIAFSKDGTFYHLGWNNDYILMNTATGSNGAGLPESQPGACVANQLVGKVTGPHVGYHLFSQGSRINCVVEKATNVFVHLSFGQIDKVGNWAGGGYVTGTYWSEDIQPGTQGKFPWDQYGNNRPFEGLANYSANGYIGNRQYRSQGHMRTDFDTRKTMQMVVAPYRTDESVNTGRGSPWTWGYELLQDSPNSFNNRAALVPISIDMQSDYSGNSENTFTRYQMGQVTDIAALNIAFINPKDMVNNDWMVFPLSQKNGDSVNYVNSGNIGLAYKK